MEENIMKDIERRRKESKKMAFNIVKALTDKRKECEISQQFLADTVGIKQSSLARTEGQSSCVRLDTACKLADALGMELVLIPKKIHPAAVDLYDE